jgi:pentose-5-phosphate-3-epimerase
MTTESVGSVSNVDIVLNRELVRRMNDWDRGVVFSGSLYGVAPEHRPAAARLLAQQRLWVHADVFADAKAGVSLDLIKELADERATPVDVHLLTADALDVLPPVCRAGVARVTFPFEGVSDPSKVAAHIRAAGAAPWLAIAPWTSVDECSDALRHVDGLLVMLVKPGTHGRADTTLLPKVDAAAGQQPVGVDGGVGEANLNVVLAAGASYVVIGRQLFGTHAVPSPKKSK